MYHHVPNSACVLNITYLWGDVDNCANSVGFRGLLPLLPNFCQLSVPEMGVCGVYSESP